MTRYYPEKPKQIGPEYTPIFPEHLLPQSAEHIWHSVWEYGKGVYTKSSYEAIVDYCRLQDLSDQTWELLQIHGIIADGSQGQTVIGPEFKAYKEIQTMLTTARDRLGLSPRAGAELGLTTLQAQQAKSKLEAFTNERD